MGNNFQWQTDTEFDPPPDSSKPQRSWEMVGFWLTTAVIIIVLASGWLLSKHQLAQVDEEIRTELQTLLDVQHAAFLAGDGDLFFASFAPDSGWQAAQLLPSNHSAHQAGLTITRVETNQDKVWANATWVQDGETIQRILFFEGHGSRYQQIATDSGYWGQLKNHSTEWGNIYYYEGDEAWLIDITAFVAKVCQQQCTQFTLMVADDYVGTAVPDQLIIPSPRLIGLDEQGNPSPIFWQRLQRILEDRLMPTTIRFAIPPPRTSPCCRMLNFEKAAAEFMRQNQNIKVELVPLDILPDDLSMLPTQVDGAAIPPTIDMVAAGDIYDLTDFAGSDTDFHATDFYEHIWQGAQWRERMWFMPLVAEYKLLYYDKQAYKTAGLPEQNLFWQWDDIDKNVSDVLAAPPDHSFLRWQFLDISKNTLFSYAYSLADSCLETAVPPCLQPLQAHHIADTLDWYKDLVQQGHIPDLTQQSTAEREHFMNNYQSAQRHALFWMGNPITYESYQLLDPVGIVPFPGVGTMEGVTPLWVNGAFISAHSKHLYATWQWLKFLSYQSPDKSYRLVPARSSVATKTNYWQNLPRSLVDPMHTAYTFSRPVTLDEKRYFDWPQLEQLISEMQTTQEIAQQVQKINWFGQK